MAFYQAQLPVPAASDRVREALAGHLLALGLEVHPMNGAVALVASEPPSRPIRSREHVIVHCHWSDHANEGVVQIECRSDESMARSQTHCREVFEAVCLRLVADADPQQVQAA